MLACECPSTLCSGNLIRIDKKWHWGSDSEVSQKQLSHMWQVLSPLICLWWEWSSFSLKDCLLTLLFCFRWHFVTFCFRQHFYILVHNLRWLMINLEAVSPVGMIRNYRIWEFYMIDCFFPLPKLGIYAYFLTVIYYAVVLRRWHVIVDEIMEVCVCFCLVVVISVTVMKLLFSSVTLTSCCLC